MHPVRSIVFAQGRSLTWVASQLGITYGYLWRMLLPPTDRSYRLPVAGFYARLALLLGEPEDRLIPEWDEEVAA